MAKPVPFEGHSGCLTGEDCRDLPVYRDGTQCISAWRLTPEELEEVNRTGLVWLSVHSGMSQPPVLISGIQLVTPRLHG